MHSVACTHTMVNQANQKTAEIQVSRPLDDLPLDGLTEASRQKLSQMMEMHTEKLYKRQLLFSKDVPMYGASDSQSL